VSWDIIAWEQKAQQVVLADAEHEPDELFLGYGAWSPAGLLPGCLQLDTVAVDQEQQDEIEDVPFQPSSRQVLPAALASGKLTSARAERSLASSTEPRP